MKIFINFKNKKTLITTKKFQSVNSIINQYFTDNHINKNINNFFIHYNGTYLNKDLSLEKYNILDGYVINIDTVKKGGSNFFSYAKKNMLQVIIALTISMLPIFILPLGFIPLTASLIKVILERSTSTIGKYLICTLNKTTLYSRMKLVLFFIKYIIFFLMIFVIITFPLIILCVTMKGHSITDNPSKMCSPVSVGNIAGMVLTMVFVFTYIFFRCGDYFLKMIINLCKKIYILNVLINPTLKSLLISYDEVKYWPIYIIPYLGQAIMAYFDSLTLILPQASVILSIITDLGCKSSFSKEDFMKKLNENMNNQKNDKNNKNISDSVSIFSSNVSLCNDALKCCDGKNFKRIGDSFIGIIQNTYSLSILKFFTILPTFVLLVSALYEAALTDFDKNDVLKSGTFDEKKKYLRSFSEDKSNILSENLKNSIDKYLLENSSNLLSEIEKQISEKYPDIKKNDIINDIKYKLTLLENTMIQFSIDDNSKYTPGNSLFKTVFKFIILDVVCNVLTTAKSSQDVISKLGEIKEMVDMLKAGTISGLLTSVCYFITLIILIICGIFNIF
jgi:hypothetical protein